LEAAAPKHQLQQFGWKPFGKKTLGRRQVEWWTVFAIEQLSPSLKDRYGDGGGGGGDARNGGWDDGVGGGRDTSTSTISTNTSTSTGSTSTSTNATHVRLLAPLELLQLNDHMRNRVWMTGPVETGGYVSLADLAVYAVLQQCTVRVFRQKFTL
jgi:hypothetical protein